MQRIGFIVFPGFQVMSFAMVTAFEVANIQLGEVVFGGVGAGLYGMLVMVVLTVFIAGLMVGRTPEYIGKKIQQKEVKMALFAILATSFLILVGSAVPLAILERENPR